MANDKKDYQDVQAALLGRSTVNSLINKLTKVHVTTEDKHLRNELATVIGVLERIVKGSVKPSAIISVDLSDHRYKMVYRYCESCIASIQPQWQILAEQNNWGPKG